MYMVKWYILTSRLKGMIQVLSGSKDSLWSIKKYYLSLCDLPPPPLLALSVCSLIPFRFVRPAEKAKPLDNIQYSFHLGSKKKSEKNGRAKSLAKNYMCFAIKTFCGAFLQGRNKKKKKGRLSIGYAMHRGISAGYNGNGGPKGAAEDNCVFWGVTHKNR